MDVPIQYGAVLGAGIVAVIIGALWYGPIFGKYWMRLIGLNPEGMKSMKMTPLGAMVGGFITSLVMAYVLAHIIAFGNAYTNMEGVVGGLTGAFWCWLGFMVTATGTVYLFEGKSLKLWVLNAGYYLVTLLAMGAVLGLWM